jgi:hypothetical protein
MPWSSLQQWVTLLCLVPLLWLCCVVQVSETLLRVIHLIDESSELLTPRMLGKVLRHNLTAPLAKLWGAGLAPAGTGSGSGGSTGAGSAAGEAGA